MSDYSEWTHDNLIRRVNQLEVENERYEAALRKIDDWAKAYPLDVFPEPDFGLVNEVLRDGGFSLNWVSASIKRRVIGGVGRIAGSALKGW